MSTPEKRTRQRLSTGEEICCQESFDLEVPPGNRTQYVRVSLGKISVILRRPTKGKIQMDNGARGRGARISTGCDDIQAAIGFAEEYLSHRQVVALSKEKMAAVAVAAADGWTLTDLLLLCREHYLTAALSSNHRRSVELAFACSIEIFGAHDVVKNPRRATRC